MPRAKRKISEEPRDASLRVSKRIRDDLKAAAAVMGRPLYDVTNDAINEYLKGIDLNKALKERLKR